LSLPFFQNALIYKKKKKSHSRIARFSEDTNVEKKEKKRKKERKKEKKMSAPALLKK
jgi:hypothetical protein